MSSANPCNRTNLDYLPQCLLCLDNGDSCIACDRVHATHEPLERALTAWLKEQAEVSA